MKNVKQVHIIKKYGFLLKNIYIVVFFDEEL